jgi:hypothetical protein
VIIPKRQNSEALLRDAFNAAANKCELPDVEVFINECRARFDFSDDPSPVKIWEDLWPEYEDTGEKKVNP